MCRPEASALMDGWASSFEPEVTKLVVQVVPPSVDVASLMWLCPSAAPPSFQVMFRAPFRNASVGNSRLRMSLPGPRTNTPWPWVDEVTAFEVFWVHVIPSGDENKASLNITGDETPVWKLKVWLISSAAS